MIFIGFFYRIPTFEQSLTEKNQSDVEENVSNMGLLGLQQDAITEQSGSLRSSKDSSSPGCGSMANTPMTNFSRHSISSNTSQLSSSQLRLGGGGSAGFSSWSMQGPWWTGEGTDRNLLTTNPYEEGTIRRLSWER